MPIVILESPSNIRAAYHPYRHRHRHPHHTNCTQSCMPVFIFWIASQNTGKCMYHLKIPITHPFFRSSISIPLLTATQYFWPWVTPHKPLFDFYHNQLQHLFPYLFFFLLQLPGHPHIPSQDDPLNRHRKYLCSTSSREFKECPNKARDHTWRKRR